MTGSAALLRLALRRDRVWLPAWLLVLVSQVAVTVSAYASLYPDPASRRALQATLGGNPALTMLYGPAYDLSTVGGLTAWRLGGYEAAMAALMCLLTVLRHTRAEEESGRLELLRAGVVARVAPLVAALAEAALAAALLGGLTTALMVAQGLPPAGSIALGAGFLGVGLAFAAVGLVTAQLSQSSRTTRGAAVAALVLAYLLRGAGDAGGPGSRWLRWLSPIGWSQEVRPFAGEHWPVLALLPALAALLSVLAVVLQRRRDFGAGLVAPRPGPARGRLGTTYGLAWRLQRGPLVAWSLGMVVVGAVVGGLAGSVGSLAQSVQVEQLLHRIGGSSGLVDVLFAASLGLLAVLGSAQAVQAVLLLRGEEAGGHAELLLASGASRSALLASHVGYAVVGPVVLMTAAGAAMGGVRAAATSQLAPLGRILLAAWAQLPAIWVLAGATLCLVGFAPRLAASAWALLALCAALFEVGALARLPEALLRVSPYASSPRLPGGTLDVLPPGALLAVALVLGLLGRSGFLRRDLTS